MKLDYTIDSEAVKRLISVYMLGGLGLFFIFVWLVLLSMYIFKLAKHYNSLIGQAENKSLQETLDSLLKENHKAKKDLADLMVKYDKIEKDGKLHIQKIGLLRFNPFKDTGGDQSFVVALVDAADTGVVISGLYSRSGTRWYAKRVISGKGSEHELSEEERKAIQVAKTA